METSSVTENQLADPRLSLRWKWGSNQPISFLMQQGVENPNCISLAAGLVDFHTLPVEPVRAASAQVLADAQRAQAALQYGTTPGSNILRQLLVEHLARLEGCTADALALDPDQLVLTTGSQQLLSLIGEILLDPQDICLVASPTYFVFLGTLNGLGANIMAVDTDEDGMKSDALEMQFEELDRQGLLQRVKLVYLVDYYENPSGVSLSETRRREILEIVQRWSKRQRIFILEDSAYRELRYDGPELPSIWGLDRSRETVILAQTFSKSFSPGLRVGFGVLPEALVAPACDRKGNEDFGSAHFNQRLLAEILQSGVYLNHVEHLQQNYRTKRDAMLSAADRYFSDLPGVSWVKPHGGLYVWMTVPRHIDTSFAGPLFPLATGKAGVMYVPGDFCFAGAPQTRPKNHLRLSFGVQSVEGIDEGMRRLAEAIGQLLT